MTDIREDGEALDAWIAVMPKEVYSFPLRGNIAFDVCWLAGKKYREQGYRAGGTAVQSVFKHVYAGNRHRSRYVSASEMLKGEHLAW